MQESIKTHRRAAIGNTSNFWLFSSETGFDLTHPSTPNDQAPGLRVALKTKTSPVTLSPSKTALIIVDMQNFFLSPAFGRSTGAGHAACEQLINYAIRACRKAGIQIVWLNWGLTAQEVHDMPPAVKRAFGFWTSKIDMNSADARSKWIPGVVDVFAETEESVAVDKMGVPRHKGEHELLENGKSGKIYKGLGSPCGMVQLEDGSSVDAGRLLMRDTWNAALYPPLDKLYKEGLNADVPDVWVHKNRMSGLWGSSTALQEFLDEKGLRTLMFTGVNTDQCVSGTLTDAFSKGFDCILLSDGAGTTSPHFAQECIEYNSAKTYGFVSDCKSLYEAVEAVS